MKGFVGGIPIALLAAAAQAMEHGTQNTQDMQTRSHYPHFGGTAIGGPSGNDADDGFTGFSTNVNTKTEVDEYSKDDHSVNIKETDVYPPLIPVFGPGEGPFPKRSQYPHYGGTAIGGPSGNDEGQTFDMPFTANVQTTVDEYAKDDHSVKVKDTDIYPPPFVPFGAPFKRDWEPEVGGTAIGGPSGNDGGQTFSAPITVDVTTGVHEHYEDDHSIDLQHEDVYPPPFFPIGGAPFRRAYSPDRVTGGGTAIGGPSGEDGGVSFGNPTSVGVDSNVNEHSEDNHSINVDTTHVHPPAAAVPHMPWMPSHEEAPVEHPGAVAVPEVETPDSASAPPSTPREDQDDHEEVPQCAAQTHQVVRTVTKTQYKEVHPTLTVYATPVVSHAVQTTAAVPMSATPEESYVDPKVVYSAPVAPSSSVPYHNYNSHRPMSSSVAYSMVPVQVPVATPSSSNVMKSMATPSSSHGLPIGADALQRPSTSAKPSVIMFQGSAVRVSGGIASVAAAVVGVLAFVL